MLAFCVDKMDPSKNKLFYNILDFHYRIKVE
jgi:hypothetical protein